MTEYAFIPPAAGQPQSAFVGAETPSLAIDRGEPDEIVSMAVVAVLNQISLSTFSGFSIKVSEA